MLQNPHVLLTFEQVQNPLRLPRETTSNFQNGPYMVCFVHFDFEMCFAPKRRALFDISTSKSGPKLVCFVHFDFEMCSPPQRRTLFRHLHFQKSGPELVCFVHFDFEMCFALQRRAIFHLSSGQLAPHLRFSEPTFRPSGATNNWKNTVFRDFATFSRTWIFFLLRLSLF